MRYLDFGCIGGHKPCRCRAEAGTPGTCTRVVRFTQDKAGKVLYAHIFGDPAGTTLTLGALASKRKLFEGTIAAVQLLVNGIAKPIAWTMQEDGLHVTLPERMPFTDANVIRISTSGL
jgi:hypothetical protein